jgi:apolipoprotein N-acyltransferase
LPLFAALRSVTRARDAFLVGLTCGLVTNLGGYYWLVGMLERFSGFPRWLCFLLTIIVCAYQGGQLALFCLLMQRVRARGMHALALSPLLFVACEHVYPLLFPSYLASSLHGVPVLMQVVDLGGPLLLSAVLVAINATLFQLARALTERRRPLLASSLPGLVLLSATLLYGQYRLGAVERSMQQAPTLDVGLVQANLGLLQKRKDFDEAVRRHVELSRGLLAGGAVDLLVWPESAVPITLPERPTDVGGLLGTEARARPTRARYSSSSGMPNHAPRPRLERSRPLLGTDTRRARR